MERFRRRTDSASFREEARNVEARLAALAEQRKTHALAAARGDNAAKASIADLDRQASELRSERETLEAAADEAAREQREAERKAAHAARRKRETEAAKARDEVLRLSADADQALVHLRDVLERRAAALRTLDATGIVASGLVQRIIHGDNVNAAAMSAGLRGLMVLGHVPPARQRTLGEVARALNGKLTAPTAEEAQTQRERAAAERRARDLRILATELHERTLQIEAQAIRWERSGDKRAADVHRTLLTNLAKSICAEFGLDPRLAAEVQPPQLAEAVPA